jgi:NCAIR mutase (PurE)-related protein
MEEAMAEVMAEVMEAAKAAAIISMVEATVFAVPTSVVRGTWAVDPLFPVRLRSEAPG